MKFIQLLVVIVLVFQTQAWFYKPKLTGKGYQSMLAEYKLKEIQSNIDQGSSKPASYPLLKLAELFIQNNDLAFDTVGDDMPIQGIFPLRGKRDKLIHPAGMIAQCQFESNGNHDYTGIFKGVDNAFVRFSVANAPETKSHTFTPGFVFKFLRDGVPSANIFSMYALTGQSDSSNIFEHDMTSHVPMLNNDAGLQFKLLAKNFEKTSDYPVFLGLSEASQYDQKGNEESEPKFPFRLQFHPSKQAHESMQTDLKITNYFYLDAMKGKQIEGTMFEVYAQEDPYSELEHIGNIKMTTAFESSDYADQTLYFQHQRFEEDLQLKPEWKQATEDIIADQENTYPEFHYPDIGY